MLVSSMENGINSAFTMNLIRFRDDTVKELFCDLLRPIANYCDLWTAEMLGDFLTIMQMSGHPTVGLLIARTTRYDCPFPPSDVSPPPPPSNFKRTERLAAKMITRNSRNT